LLKRAMIGMRGEAGAIWICDAQRRLVLQSEICLEATGFLQDAGLRGAAEPQFAEVMRTGGAVAFQVEQQLQNGAPRKRNLCLAGLSRDSQVPGSQVTGLVQVFEGPGATEEQRPERLQFLGQLCASAARFWKNRPTSATPNPPLPSTMQHPGSQPGSQHVVAAHSQVPSGYGPSGNGPTLQSVPGISGRPRAPSLPGSSTHALPIAGPQTGPQAGPALPPATAAAQSVGGPAVGLLDDDQWVLALHGSQKIDEAAFIAANECRRLLGADRVSIAEQYGPKVKIQSVSGQQTVSARSNAIRLLTQLTEKVLATGEKLIFTGDTQKFPPQFEAVLANYLLESRSRVIIILPVFGPKPADQESQDKPEFEKHLEKPAPVGGIIVEQISENPLPADIDERLDRIGHHVGLALRNVQSRERVFLLPLWMFLGNWKTRLKGRTLAKIATGVGVLAAIVLTLMFVPWDYRVSGKGRLMPVVRRGLFAPHDGEVVELIARSGQPVKAGELLVRLKSDELQTKLLTATTQLAEKRQSAFAIESQLSQREAASTPATEIELQGKLQQFKVEIEGAKLQVESLQRQIDSLSVRSPIDGVVATFRLEEMLRLRPVKYGDLLLEVMDPTQAWRLEIDVPENRIGHILEAQHKKNLERLPVSYMLATATEATYQGELESLSTRSGASETEGTVVPVFVDLVAPSPPAPRIGAEVKAKIDCGRASLGYVLFGDVIEFLRKWFWL
ncbi:MAG TPA: efflux RND transporter periplasmic adaptor subunit, partial [Planctomycetaceae bacterium]